MSNYIPKQPLGSWETRQAVKQARLDQKILDDSEIYQLRKQIEKLESTNMKPNQTENLNQREAWLIEKVAEAKAACQDESFAAIEELRKGPHGLLLDLLDHEARLAEFQHVRKILMTVVEV